MLGRNKKIEDEDDAVTDTQRVDSGNGFTDQEAAAGGYHEPIDGADRTVGNADLHDPDSGVKRGLKNRHLSMMALAGIIGPGLLIGSGGALSNGGPASLLIGFGVVGE